MSLNVGREVTALQRLGVAELRQRYAAVFGEATASGNKAWLAKRIAWRLQANAEGGLSDRARQRAGGRGRPPPHPAERAEGGDRTDRGAPDPGRPRPAAAAGPGAG